MSQEQTVLKQFQVRFTEASHLPLHYVNAMNVRTSPEGFFVTIGATLPPEVNSPEDLDKIDVVHAEPISRFVLSPDVMPSIIALLTQQYETYQRIRKALEEQQKALRGDGPQGKGSEDGN